jgi:hypothetical protein
MSSEDSDSSAETDTDSLDETDTDESASDSSAESQLKPSDIGDVNSITPPLSTNDHVRTSPLELHIINGGDEMKPIQQSFMHVQQGLVNLRSVSV